MTEFNVNDDIADPIIDGQKYVCITYVPHPGQNTIFFKIRGSYQTIDEAHTRALELAQTDPMFPIYVGEVGKFLPAQSHMINLSHLTNLSENQSNNVPINIIAEPTVITEDDIDSEDHSNTSITSSCGPNMISSTEDIEQTEEDITNNQNEEESAGTQCLACTDAQRNSLLLPCRHLVFCLSCSQKHLKTLSTCPICRKKISEVINVFIP